MSPVRILRKAFVFSLAILLTAVVFTGCGEKADSGIIDYSRKEGGEELLKGKAAYEIGEYRDAALNFSLASQKGNAAAMYWLGKCFLYGTGLERDVEKALLYFRSAEMAGYFIDGQTQYDVGVCFFSGDGVKEDRAEAFEWWRKSADKLHLGAMMALNCFGPVDLSNGVAEVTVFVPSGDFWKMMKVEAGTFEMSARDGENNDSEVPHQATLTKDFYIGQTEVTQAQWCAVMGTNPSDFKGDDLPVESVSWNDAMEFCGKLNDMGKAPKGWKFTLPTETQWEYAARAGNRNRGHKYSGSNNIGEVAWYYENSGDRRLNDSSWDDNELDNNHCKTHPVGQKKWNNLGLYDMSGNVWEWCLDDWSDKSDRLTAEFSRGNDRGGSVRAIRGGCWNCEAWFCRSADRYYYAPGNRSDILGFRVALVPESY